ncbi:MULTISPECIES: NAD-dependent epimerase/dehydratase family protein [unclassified Streptomyces]|uniref:NAD-dependent epimerase/dehydratase family protein n=1 Tax=unclassified Streptomyces TaxID=2593676 RepID=UPI002254296F|nr:MULTISPECIES: NAD(P)-dependent oxidoreductase [unclassified Streptomyces]MCX4792089.1 NAD(P)-dependent oxidoreductase [Streptomyces sp. NBC_01221]MCX4799993.1 NAD(P)-dependent oxidoreductase [Streptomyces sp. NBC_01242]WSJ40615.1 NAD(P)-dependent oxidoreductase [Streptomyces sp. NBC_01321]WSP66936.1 NAD(P)-dependent oxidoreductase [Streptomyces sp. NBC_01240]
MGTKLETVAITGAAGRIGSVVRVGLRDEVARLVLIDRVGLTAQAPTEDVHQLDLRDAEAVTAVLKDVDAVVHLGGVPDEAPLPDLLDGNVRGTHNVLEGARRQGVRRVVLASSNRVSGFYPVAETVTPEMPARPDGLYGVSKVAVEALGRLYADKFGLSVVCLRIGSFEDAPSERRHLSTWLSPRDGIGFVRTALTAPDVRFETVYAVSANTRRFWDTDAGADLGYVPVDDAEAFASLLPKGGDPAENDPQGGEYASAEYTLRHM